MAEKLIESIQEKLKEETWTRATIANFTSTNLAELEAFVKEAKETDLSDEVIAVCYEHLNHTKDSVSALYLAGMLSLDSGNLDDISLETLVDILNKNHKEQMVATLCETILDATGQTNLFALRTRAELKKAADPNNEEVWNDYKKIVQLDLEECELVKQLAEHEAELGHEASSKDYYKMAIRRYTKARNQPALEAVWNPYAKKYPDETDFFLSERRVIAKQMGDAKANILMTEVYQRLEVENNPSRVDYAITILKQILATEPKDTSPRQELIKCYKIKYGSKTDEKQQQHVEDYIQRFMPSYRDVNEAISDFEKHIAFDKGAYVFHQSWGIGIIGKIENEKLYIKFGKKYGIKEITLKMAVSNLKPLSKDHIWVIKARGKYEEKGIKNADDLKSFLKENVSDTLEIIIKSYNNSCDFKRIKSELVPSILDAKEWTSWNSKAKKELETNAKFGTDPNDINCYVVRAKELKTEEKLSIEFKAQKQFFARADILMRFLHNPDTDKTSDLFAEMYNYFSANLKNIYSINDQVVASYLLCRQIHDAGYKHLEFPACDQFANIYAGIEDPREMYENLKETKATNLKSKFIECIKTCEVPEWNNEYIRLFPVVLDKSMITTLIDNGFQSDVEKLVVKAFENCRDFRESILFFFKECKNDDWFKAAGVSEEKQLIALVNLIELACREINSHVNSTDNKKIRLNAYNFLFKEENLFNYIKSTNDINVAKKLFQLVIDVVVLDPEFNEENTDTLQKKIKTLFPEFEIKKIEKKIAATESNTMFVTNAKLTEKKANREKILKEDLPDIVEKIAEAKEKGDLKENAEYHSAREKQNLLNKEERRLKEEIDNAIPVDPASVSTSTISFGTVVTLTNNATNEDVVYTIFGPWESDPENGIISYKSPVGAAIMEKKVGDKVVINLADIKHDFTVKEIKAAKF